MTARQNDPRQSEADRIHAEYVRQGFEPSAVAALLPALIGEPEGQRYARAWLDQYGRTGLDLSDEGRAHSARLADAAYQTIEHLIEAGACGPNPYNAFDGRYDPDA